MPDDIYFLSRQDVDDLRAIHRAYKTRSLSTRNRPAVEEDTGQAPDMYLARSPAGGIAAPSSVGTGTPPSTEAPNSAVCPIWRLSQISGQIEDISGTTQTVFTLIAVPGNTWILIQRDKFGTWWVTTLASDANAPTDTAIVEATSPSYQSVSLGASWSGGTVHAYPAQQLELVAGAWTPTVVGWFYGVNGEVPIKGGYFVKVVAYDTSTPAKPVWSTDIPALTVFLEVTSLTSTDISLAGVNPGETATVYPAQIWVYTGIGTGSWSIQSGPAWFMPINRETPALDTRYLCRFVAVDTSSTVVWGCEIFGGGGSALAVLDESGATVDGAVVSIKADPLLKQTWTELSSGHVQLVLNTGAIVWNGGTTVLLPGAPTWDLVGYAFNFISSSGGYFTFNAALEICNYQFWCCASVTFVSPPSVPVTSTVAGGALAATTYYIRVTYTSTAGESGPCTEITQAVAANNLLVVDSPATIAGATGWNVYVSTATGTETKQNATPIALGTNWTEPATGLIAGTAFPATGFVDDWILPAAKTVFDITPATSGTTLSSIVPALLGGVTGPEIIVLHNVGVNGLTVQHNSGRGTATNGILLPPTYGTEVILMQNDSITLWYDTCATNRWAVIACTVDDDAGGGGLQLLDKTGTVIDADCVSIKADPNNQQTWLNLSAGHDQLVVNIAFQNVGATAHKVAATLIEADNFINGVGYSNAYAFGRICWTDLTGGAGQFDWMGLRLYQAGSGFVGPEPDIEFIAGYGITWTLADDVTDARVQAKAAVRLDTDTTKIASAATTTSTTLTNISGFTLVLPATGTYLITAKFQLILTNKESVANAIYVRITDTTTSLYIDEVSLGDMFGGMHTSVTPNPFTTISSSSIYTTGGGTTLQVGWFLLMNTTTTSQAQMQLESFISYVRLY